MECGAPLFLQGSLPCLLFGSQPLFTGAHGVVPPAYEVLKEHEVAVLGVPQSQAPVTTTVINIGSETSVKWAS